MLKTSAEVIKKAKIKSKDAEFGVTSGMCLSYKSQQIKEINKYKVNI
ncbi:MAG: hypothetical protein ABIM18_07835 [candidate division WOR-3 bacterium]